MAKLIKERIARTSSAPLTAGDLKELTERRNRKLLFLLPPYFSLVTIGIYLLISGASGVNGAFHKDVIKNEEGVSRFGEVAPYVISFFLLMATIYFIRLFLQMIYPLMRDIREGKKQEYYFNTSKSAMPLFNRYYISTPLYDKQQVEISREVFDSITDNEELVLEAGPRSLVILKVKLKGSEIEFY